MIWYGISVSEKWGIRGDGMVEVVGVEDGAERLVALSPGAASMVGGSG